MTSRKYISSTIGLSLLFATGCAGPTSTHEPAEPVPLAEPISSTPPTQIASNDGGVQGAAVASGPNALQPYLQVIQQTNVVTVADWDTVPIVRQPFAFRFPIDHYRSERKLFHHVKLTASASAAVHRIAGVPLDGVDSVVHPFGQGTGLAGHADGGYRGKLFLNDQAHHHITFHPDDPSLQRAQFHARLGPLRSEVDFSVSSVSYKGQTISLEALPLETIYVAVLFDENLNQKVDEGELFRVVLQFVEWPRGGTTG